METKKKLSKLLFGIKDFAIISSYLCIKKLLHAFLIFRISFLKIVGIQIYLGDCLALFEI